MPRSISAAALVLAVLVLRAPAARSQACDDFSAYTTCPPPAGRCSLGPDPDSCAQDCSTCTPASDDDGDCVSDEELLNDRDDDGDGLIDEDISCLNSCDPLSFECPTSGFPAADFTVPSPVDGLLTLPSRLDHWSCSGSADDLLDLDVELASDLVDPNPFCGGYRIVLRLRGAGGGPVHFEGPAILVHTRSWESLDRALIPGAAGNVQVYRWLVKADLVRLTPFAQLPAPLRVPCSEDQATRKHLFFYGQLDVARDASAPLDRSRYRAALALHHAPGEMSHPVASYSPAMELCGFADVTKRAIARGAPAAHDGEGWFLVGPRASFTFSAAVPGPTGAFREGRIHQVPTGPGDCRKETRICESRFEAATPGGVCPSRRHEQRAYFCGQDDGSVPCPHFNLVSATKCETVPNDRLAFLPVGEWSGSEFPAPMQLSFVEGGWVCRANFEPYWYGVYTETPGSGAWRGPARALDVIDNQIVQLTGLGQWLIGSCNWFAEGTASERFVPRQFRTMYFFPSVNPDIPRLAPCVATAVIAPAAPGGCAGGDLTLTGSSSRVVNCCQCGGLEYQWLKRVGASFTVVRDWSTDPVYRETPGPAADTDYKLVVRCSTSRRACVAEAVVTVSVGRPAADAGPDRTVCVDGPGARIGTAAVAGRSYAWTPAAGLDDPALAEPLATPAATTTYTVRVALAGDPACFSDDVVEVRVEARPGRVMLLRGAKAAADAHFEWSVEPAASGGYHAYRVLAKTDIAGAPQLGARVIDTAPGSGNTSGDHSGAVPGAAGTVFFYQVVAVCADEVSEGPL